MVCSISAYLRGDVYFYIIFIAYGAVFLLFELQ